VYIYLFFIINCVCFFFSQIVANYIGIKQALEYVPGMNIHWAGGRVSPPPDTPACGFDNSLCKSNNLHTFYFLDLCRNRSWMDDWTCDIFIFPVTVIRRCYVFFKLSTLHIMAATLFSLCKLYINISILQKFKISVPFFF